MNRTLFKGAGIGVLLAGLLACDPTSGIPNITLDLLNPTQDQENVKLDAIAEVNFSATGMALAEPPCDPSKLEIERVYDEDGYLSYVTVAPGWSPYDAGCTDDNGLPDPAQVNIQLFVDGIFHALAWDTNIPLNLLPKGDDTDVRFAQYNADYSGVDCYYYFPNDSLDYAGQMFREVAIPVAEDLFGVPFTDGSGNITEPIPVEALYYFTLYLASDAPIAWETFEYNGIYSDSDTLEFIPNHIFYAELHYNNHSAVDGAPRNRVITGQLDLGQMPADWCGFNPLL